MQNNLSFTFSLPLLASRSTFTSRIRRTRNAGASIIRHGHHSRLHMSVGKNHISRLPDRLKPDEEKLNDLQNWCEMNGLQCESLDLCSPNQARGLYAKREIHSGETLFTIPKRSAIIANTTNHHVPKLYTFKGLSSTFWKGATWYTRLSILLLDEMGRSTDSPFKAYLDTLPADPWCALWAYETLGKKTVNEKLERYGMVQVVDSYVRHVKSVFAAFMKALPEGKKTFASLKEFAWAVSICQSRAFGVMNEGSEGNKFRMDTGSPSGYALFPGLDMGNHSVHCQTAIHYDSEEDCYKVITGGSFCKDEQVYLSYGPKNNDDLMFFYGFIEGNNPADTVKLLDFREWLLDLAHGKGRTSEDWEHKLQMLREKRLISSEKSHAFHRDELCQDLMSSLRLALLGNGDLHETLLKIEEDPKLLNRALSLQNELDCWQAIEQKCLELLEVNGEFDEQAQERLTEMYKIPNCSATWEWDKKECAGELMYRYERQITLTSTLERVRHFSKVSKAVGRVCTVLLPPSQSLLKTEMHSPQDVDLQGTAGIQRFLISPQDLGV